MAIQNDLVGKHFLNQVDTIRQCLDGSLLVDTNQCRLDFDSQETVKVVVRRDWKKNCGKVAIVTGGGSGHEPAFTGFVGQGMLTAAVCGNVFASPSTTAVYQAIKAVATPEGVLVIVMNYTGDRLNFGLACEQAKSEGIKVRMLITADDIALSKIESDPQGKRNRGIAGTILVQKVAGYAAEQGMSLDQIYEFCSRANDWVKTIGVSANACKLFDQERRNSMGPNQLELGLGIHGEPGLEKIPLPNATDLVERMINLIFDKSPERNYIPTFEQNKRCVVLLNNLGSVTHIELNVLTNEIIPRLKSENAIIERFVSATWMTSLDMKGFSISIMLVDDEILEALDSPCTAPSWLPLRALNTKPITIPLYVQEEIVNNELTYVSVVDVEMITNACTALRDYKSMLNDLDSHVGDADCGNSFESICNLIEENIQQLPLYSYKKFFLSVGKRLQSAPGSSGALYACLFTSMGVHLPEDNSECTIEVIAQCCMSALQSMQEYSGAQLGDRTMIDALLPAAEIFVSTGNINEATQAALQGAIKTKSLMSANAGRSQYLGQESLAGHVDPGSVAVVIWMNSFATAKIDIATQFGNASG